LVIKAAAAVAAAAFFCLAQLSKEKAAGISGGLQQLVLL